MKSLQPPTQHAPGVGAEFYDHRTGNLLRAENTRDGGVFICAAKDNFTPVQRRNFLRYLKIEGFVPEDVQLVALRDESLHFPRRAEAIWTVDPLWPYTASRFNHYTRRLGWRLLLGLTIGWSILIWAVVFR